MTGVARALRWAVAAGATLLVGRAVARAHRTRQAGADPVAERAASEARFRATFDNAAVGMAHVGLDGRWLAFNDRLQVILGRPRAELARLTFQAVTHPDDLEADLEQVRQLLAGAIPSYTMEKRYLRPGGEAVWAQLTVSLARTAAGAPDYFIAVVEDITGRRTAEERLRAALLAAEQARRELGFQKMALDEAAIVAVTDTAGTILEVNDRFCAISGYDRDELVGSNHRLLNSGLHPAAFFRQMYATIARGGVWRGEIRNRAKDGHHYWVDTVIVPAPGADGRPERYVAIRHDVTERKRIEQALRAADARKDEFLATLAHELRNPLAPIRTGLTLLERLPGDAPAADRVRGMMRRQVTHLVRLVDDLLEVNRIRHGRIELQRARIALGDVIGAAVEAARPLIDARGHRLVLACEARPIFVEGDPVRLTQVLANLLTNAAKYTPEGGRITLGARREGSEVVLRVEDDGEGLDAELLPHLFELFTQAERTLDRAQGGLGIGLALVRQLVELHGGSVTAASPGRGAGSVFTVRLPAAPMRASDAGPGAG